MFTFCAKFVLVFNWIEGVVTIPTVTIPTGRHSDNLSFNNDWINFCKCADYFLPHRAALLFFCFALHLVYIYFLIDFCRTNYLNIYRADVSKIICGIGRIKIIDAYVQSEISISIPCSQNWVVIHRTEFLSFGDIRQMAVAHAVSLGAVHGSQRTHGASGLAGLPEFPGI